ncbi:MAG: hypothetical protein ONB24_10555 [candidate division KSB1 bacterium]|nr:hypothetical protein [candidate division KSB1 bacterium]
MSLADSALFNEAQKTSLTVTLRMLEEEILLLKRLLQGGRPQSIMFRYEDDIEPQKRQVILERLEEVLKTIREMQDKFELPVKITKQSCLIEAFLGSFWALLYEEKAAQLNRYGPVNPLLYKELDPFIDRLLFDLKQIEKLKNR